MIDWTETELSALRRAYASGTTRVSYDGKTVDYRSVAEIDRALEALAREIAAAAPLAVKAIKQTLRTAGTDDLGAVLRREAMAQAILSQTADAGEGVQAQMARREPDFKGG